MKLFYFASEDERQYFVLKFFRHNISTQKLEIYETLTPSIEPYVYRGGGYTGWLNRYTLLCNAFNICNTNEYFISSDIDIRYYEDISTEIESLISQYPNVSLWCQKESIEYGINIGFMVINNTPFVKLFFDIANSIIGSSTITDPITQTIKIKHPNRLVDNYAGSGQDHINDLLYQNSQHQYDNIYLNKDFNFYWGRLPDKYWHPVLTNKPDKLVLHHATCTGDQVEKMKQLGYV